MSDNDNKQKYYNYKVQMQRLKKALAYQFYLEAIFIEYAILEDRTNSILRYEGNPVKPRCENRHVTIEQKIKRIIKLAENKKGVAHRYFGDGIMESVREWKECRNQLMHSLMKQELTTEALSNVAESGYELVKSVSNKSRNYKKMLERRGMLREENSD